MKKVALRDVQNDRRTSIRNDPKSCILGLNADAVKVSGTERPTAESFWATLPVYYKKSRIGRKKVALRDVQNDRRTLIRNDPESCVLGLSADAIKVSGTERPTAESFWATLPECYKKSRIGEKKVALRDVQNDRRTLIHNDPESCVLGLSADAVKVSGTERPTSESFWATLPVCYKKSPIERKKVALRDVQNDRRTLIRNDPESCVLGLGADAVKVSRTERPTPESFWATLPVCYKESRIDRKKVALRDMQNDRRTLIRNDPESCVLGLSGNAVKVSGIERPTPESFWATLPVCYKKSRIGKKKVALGNVQNDRRTLIRNDPESCVLGLGADPVKVSGTKRLTPECPLNEHVTHASRNSDSELGKRRVQEASNKKSDFLKLRKYFHNKPELPQQHPEEKEINTSSVPASAPTPTATVTTFSPDRPPVPISLEKPGNGLPAAESNCVQLTSESDTPHSADSKENTDQERKEQFLHLQKPQKHCYEYDQRDYIHLFRHLSPVELNRCAVELEKRSIQLSVEEGKEIERMKALNIFGKSSLTNNPLQTFPQVQTKE